MRPRLRLRPLVVVALLALAIGAASCAAKGPRNQARVAALTVGEAVLGIDQVERTLFAQNAFDKATHDRVGAIVLKALYASRSYERAVAAWPDSSLEPSHVLAARHVLLAILQELGTILPASVSGRASFVVAVDVARAALTAAGGGQ